MAGFFSKGLVLEQHKEPALSRDLRLFTAGGGEPLSVPPAEDPALLTPEQIIQYAREAQIVDERDGRPLHEKLQEAREHGVTLAVADAIDDEPYVSSQLNPLFKLSQQAVGGLCLAAKAAGTENMLVAICKNLADAQMKIPNTLYGVKIQRITGKYPVESRAGFSNPETLLVGVCAMIHLYRAVNGGRMQTTSFITVAGNCVANPQNLEVSTGISVTQALERCGLIEEPSRIVLGGPMCGRSIDDPLHTFIQPTTRAVLAFCGEERNRHYQCIGCGKCVSACPQGLSPIYLYKAARTRYLKVLRTFDVTECIGCGTCSYICPAKLELSTVIREAGRRIRALDERALDTADTSAAERKEEQLPC